MTKITTHRNGKPFTDKRPGVCATIIEVLSNATDAKPVTKEDIVNAILARFPDRDPDKTKALVAGCPTWLKTYNGIDVSSKTLDGNKRGYWIPGAKKPTRKRDRKAEKARRAAKLAAQS